MPKDLTQQYAHYHRKWEQTNLAIANMERTIEYSSYTNPNWTRELRLAKRRARYYNKRMSQLEALSQAQGNGIGSLTWWGMSQPPSFPAVQDGYIIPATPPMYQDD